MQYDFIYIKLYITQTYLQQEKKVVSWGRAAQLRKAWITKGYEELQVLEMFTVLTVMMVSITYIKFIKLYTLNM